MMKYFSLNRSAAAMIRGYLGTFAREERYPLVLAPDNETIAVVLYLVHPCRPLGGFFAGLARLGRMEDNMATNKPYGDSARKGAVRKRSQLKSKLLGKTDWVKRDRTTGEFMAVKKGAKKFKGVRREKSA